MVPPKMADLEHNLAATPVLLIRIRLDPYFFGLWIIPNGPLDPDPNFSKWPTKDGRLITQPGCNSRIPIFRPLDPDLNSKWSHQRWQHKFLATLVLRIRLLIRIRSDLSFFCPLYPYLDFFVLWIRIWIILNGPIKDGRLIAQPGCISSVVDMDPARSVFFWVDPDPVRSVFFCPLDPDFILATLALPRMIRLDFRQNQNTQFTAIRTEGKNNRPKI